MIYKGLIEKYREYLPVSDKTPLISLLEGNTPLIPAKNLGKVLGGKVEIYLKYEGLNPTGSFKDRGMTMAISKAVEEGSKAVICASTGNTSASAAAYAARAGIKCVVLIPEGAIALGKLSQAMIHGAQVLQIKGNFDDALELVKEISGKFPITLVNSLNPYRIEGQKTGAFEVIEVLGEAPDYQFMPVGNAGNITAYWKGYKEYKEKGKTKNCPKMMGFQAAGSAPIVLGHPVKDPKTLATAIKIGNPASWKQAEAARDESGGIIDMVSDDDIVNAYKMLASLEGVFCEPASAAGVAGLKKYIEKGYFQRTPHVVSPRETIHGGRSDSRQQTIKVVCILTGHGLKDPDRAIKVAVQPKVVEAKIDIIKQEIGL